MSALTILPDTFTPPPDTDPASYFRDSFGVMVTQAQPKTVKIKVESRQAKYFRGTPAPPLTGRDGQRQIFNIHIPFAHHPRLRVGTSQLRAACHCAGTARTENHADSRPPRSSRQLHIIVTVSHQISPASEAPLQHKNHQLKFFFSYTPYFNLKIRLFSEKGLSLPPGDNFVPLIRNQSIFRIYSLS